MFAVSIAYVLVHHAVAPLRTGYYAMHFTGAMFRTLAQYWTWSVGPTFMETPILLPAWLLPAGVALPLPLPKGEGTVALRLEGPALARRVRKEMISEGVSSGAVQVTPVGQAIILFVEQQTAGGYPKIANVVGADLFCIGQLRPRDEIRFERVTFEQARRLWIEQQKRLNSEEFLLA